MIHVFEDEVRVKYTLNGRETTFPARFTSIEDDGSVHIYVYSKEVDDFILIERMEKS